MLYSLRQMSNSEACKGKALSRSDSQANPDLMLYSLRQMSNSEACKGKALSRSDSQTNWGQDKSRSGE